MRFTEILEAASAPQFTGPEYSKFSDLKAAIAKEWGNVPELTRQQVSSKGSQRGFTLGRSHLINTKTNKVVGYWETTGADMIPGRGTVTTGYGQVASKPKRAAATPKAPKVPTAKAPATPVELKDALIKVMALMKTQDGRADYEPIEGNSFNVRHWGEWEVPADEEDDGDYDWKVISDKTEADLKALEAKMAGLYPTVKVSFQGEEKEWLTVGVSSRIK